MIWKQVAGWPEYEVSDSGSVRRVSAARGTTRRVLRGWTTGRGYIAVGLTVGDRIAKPFVHRLVCEAFHGPRPSPDHYVAHWDGDKRNNAAVNLRWATVPENVADSHRLNAFRLGESNRASRLSADDVRAIRGRLHKGEGQRVIAMSYGVTQTAISKIALGKCWAHVR